MTRVKITSKQYNAILLREQESRLECNITSLKESFNKDTELLEEGLKEVLLGVAKLLDVKLSGVNKVAAENALKDELVISEIKDILEDGNKIKELSKTFAEKGMKEPDLKLANNAKKIIDNFNKLSENKKLNDKALANIESLSKELVREKEKAKKKAEKKKSILVKDTIKAKFNTDDVFIRDGHVLNSVGVNEITSIFDSIKSSGGTIISIKIESSTDSKLVVKHKSSEDPTGNITMATLRTKSIADLIDNTDDKIHITHREIPNNGSDIVSTKAFLEVEKDEEKLRKLRKKTAEFRYIELTIVSEFEGNISEEEKPEVFVKDYRSNLNKSDKKLTYPNKKVKCSLSNKKINCSTI